jgi:hypothetical protein
LELPASCGSVNAGGWFFLQPGFRSRLNQGVSNA